MSYVGIGENLIAGSASAYATVDDTGDTSDSFYKNECHPDTELTDCGPGFRCIKEPFNPLSLIPYPGEEGQIAKYVCLSDAESGGWTSPETPDIKQDPYAWEAPDWDFSTPKSPYVPTPSTNEEELVADIEKKSYGSLILAGALIVGAVSLIVVARKKK